VEAKNLADLHELPLVEWKSIEAVLDRDAITQAPDTAGRTATPSRWLRSTPTDHRT
jgi:hypothetical protein